MGIFDNVEGLVGQVQKLAAEHPDQVKDALDKAEGLIDDKTGHRFSGQLEQGVAQAAHLLQAPAPKPAEPQAP
jgi:hypothetical protein